MLEIDSLTTRYFQGGRPVTATRNVSITVPAGTSTALVGESGSGKSTVALSVMRMIRPPIGEIVDGRITVSGHDVTRMSEKEMRPILRSEIGLIPQDPTTALDPLYTIRSQIREALDGSTDDARIVELLQSLGIKDAGQRLRDHPHQFSGGMRQRVAIAIALSKDPSVLIADEPTTALDVTTQIGILRLLDRLRTERDMATLFVTHDIRVARLLCQSVVVMYGGLVVESGPTTAVADQPSHPYTRALLESSSLDVGHRQRLRAIPGSPPSLDAMPTGCPFAPRCANATSQCESELPPDVTRDDGVTFKCWNPVTATAKAAS